MTAPHESQHDAAVLAVLALCASAGAQRFDGLRIDAGPLLVGWDEAVARVVALPKPVKLMAALGSTGVIVVRATPFEGKELDGWRARLANHRASVLRATGGASGTLEGRLFAIAGTMTQIVSDRALELFRENYLITPLSYASDTPTSDWARLRGYRELAIGKADRIVAFGNEIGTITRVY